MDAQYVLQASVLDIIFDGRNKDYGAYLLRKEYNRRLKTAMLITGSLLGGLLIVYYSQGPEAAATVFRRPEVVVEVSRIAERPVEPPKPIAPKTPAAPQVRAMRFAGPPVIVQNAATEDAPPENDALDHVRIGKIDSQGILSDNVAPPESVVSGVTAMPTRNADDDGDGKIFRKVEIESAYPGGPEAWRRFLGKTLHYPEAAVENGVQGTVVIQFVVDIDGAVSDIAVLDGPEALRGEAARVIKRSGAWTPAIQNGRKVKSVKTQPITFMLASE